jgi:hypothetical protein
MKNMKPYFLIILALSSILSCRGGNSPADETCGKQVSKGREYFNNFYFTKQAVYLDSALQILKGVENCSSKYTNTIFMDEMQVYFLKKNFSSALEVLNKVPATVFPFPSLKDVFENKIRAKEAETKGDTISQRKYYGIIVSLYEHYMDENNQMFVNTLCQSEYEKIGNKEVDFVVTELYYYISKTEGIATAINKLTVYQKNIQGNMQYFDELKKNIRKNDPDKMGIMLY